jgi:hypothetical protein
LQELARFNNANLLKTLKSDLIDAALSFGQTLASLSCMFIGARGLSNSIDLKNIIRIVYSHMKKGHVINLSVDKYPPRNSKSMLQISEGITSPNTCPTCLLSE